LIKSYDCSASSTNASTSILFAEFTDIETFSRNDRIAATLDAIILCVPVIYQPVFVVQHRLLIRPASRETSRFRNTKKS